MDQFHGFADPLAHCVAVVPGHLEKRFRKLHSDHTAKRKLRGGEPFTHGLAPPFCTRAILKHSINPGGTQSLRRQRKRLETLRAQDIGERFGFQIPTILAFVDSGDSVWSIETFVPGVDGRVLLRDSGPRQKALASAGNLIMAVQADGAEPARADEAWAGEWIDRTADALRAPVKTIMSDTARSAAVASFRRHLAHAFRGRALGAGWYHGDFSPGNLLYAGLTDRDGSPESRVSAILDWDRAGRGGPVGFDVCQLAMTARRVVTGHQLGSIVVDLLRAGQWNEEERAWLSRVESLDGPDGDWTRDASPLRAMVLLVWARQILANIEKYDQYARNRLWSAANVEWVLRYILRNPH